MTPPPLWLMLAFVAALYLATYGPGRALLAVARVRPGGFWERAALSCAVGAAVLGWIGYLAVVVQAPWLATAGGWAAITSGLLMLLWGLRGKRETSDLNSRERLVLRLAVAGGILYAAGMNYWQLKYSGDGSLEGRFLWPDLLYRNGVLTSLLNCNGQPDWPWLAGIPMKGMSLLRFTALVPVMKALAIPGTMYQVAALWLGLFGVPVAAGTAFAFFRALGAEKLTSAVATLLTALLGNPRWLLNDRFAHSPALHWAGTDVFAICVPVLFALLTLIVLALRQSGPNAPRQYWRGVWGWAPVLLLLVSGMGHAPFEALAIYSGLPLLLLIALIRRRGVKPAVLLTIGALVGLVVLKVLMGSGSGGASPLTAIAPTPTIRVLAWAFPFLNEPLSPLLANPSPVNLMKFLKFAAVYPIAILFYVSGSLWVRSVILLAAHRFPWAHLRRPEYLFGLCLAIMGVLISSFVDFNKLAYQGAQYDVLRTLWPALLLANLALAWLVVENWSWLKRGWGLLLLLVLLLYGTWENTQLTLWSRTGLPVSIVAADEMNGLRALAQQAKPDDVVLIDPRYKPTPSRFSQIEYVGHNWGYVSGLLNARIYLDNEDMARKFGQGEMWDQRYEQLSQALQSTDATTLRNFLTMNGIRWIMLEGDEQLQVPAEQVGLKQVFHENEVRIYQVL